MNSPLRLGIGTGGTYTDAVLVDGRDAIVAAAKRLTTHHDLALGIDAAPAGTFFPGAARRLAREAGAGTCVGAASAANMIICTTTQSRLKPLPRVSCSGRSSCRRSGFSRDQVIPTEVGPTAGPT